MMKLKNIACLNPDLTFNEQMICVINYTTNVMKRKDHQLIYTWNKCGFQITKNFNKIII